MEAALADAMIGDNADAQKMSDALNQKLLRDTQMQSLWLPAIHGQIALNHKDTAGAVSNLEIATPPVEYAQFAFLTANSTCLYPTYVRGEAYLGRVEGSQAAAEFQKIIDHSGMVWNCATGALAKLGRGAGLCAGSEERERRRCRCGASAGAGCVQGFSDALEGRRRGHPGLPAGEGGVCESAAVGPSHARHLIE